jgi:hypothetical protein
MRLPLEASVAVRRHQRYIGSGFSGCRTRFLPTCRTRKRWNPWYGSALVTSLTSCLVRRPRRFPRNASVRSAPERLDDRVTGWTDLVVQLHHLDDERQVGHRGLVGVLTGEVGRRWDVIESVRGPDAEVVHRPGERLVVGHLGTAQQVPLVGQAAVDVVAVSGEIRADQFGVVAPAISRRQLIGYFRASSETMDRGRRMVDASIAGFAVLRTGSRRRPAARTGRPELLSSLAAPLARCPWWRFAVKPPGSGLGAMGPRPRTRVHGRRCTEAAQRRRYGRPSHVATRCTPHKATHAR